MIPQTNIKREIHETDTELNGEAMQSQFSQTRSVIAGQTYGWKISKSKEVGVRDKIPIPANTKVKISCVKEITSYSIPFLSDISIQGFYNNSVMPPDRVKRLLDTENFSGDFERINTDTVEYRSSGSLEGSYLVRRTIQEVINNGD